ncbi:hypothetical protein IscW_ISCW019545 [Ixodes scapularis]|uniref:Uncharacterized protein n=1 Tax=Ixodes scapularis TaxID=6945 RepID=B7PWP8_IXOSC|nr:hypothetical protein IscW_ISCW019545 [Ixodes scapularis]|eukprot:XP_002410174.1 hypothetical protein IscW_ISCW019545 [Ixodes scapularis]
MNSAAKILVILFVVVIIVNDVSGYGKPVSRRFIKGEAVASGRSEMALNGQAARAVSVEDTDVEIFDTV